MRGSQEVTRKSTLNKVANRNVLNLYFIDCQLMTLALVTLLKRVS